MSGNHQGEIRGVRLMESTDLVFSFTCQLVGGGLNKGVVVPVSTYVPGESFPNLCLSGLHPEASQFSFFTYVPGALPVFTTKLEPRVSESMLRLLSGNAWDSSSLLSHSDAILAGFQNQML